METEKNNVPMLEKALAVLTYIAASPGSVTLPELQKNLGIPYASCYRIVHTLVKSSFLERCGGGGFDIGAELLRTAQKKNFHLEKYRKFQSVLEALVRSCGFAVKISVRTGDSFVNVCAARDPESLLAFSEPGYCAPLGIPASVSTIFLAEEPDDAQKRIVEAGEWPRFVSLLKYYRTHGYCFIRGGRGGDARFPLDTLSFPLRRGGILRAVVSFLGLAGSMCGKQKIIAERAAPFFELLSGGL